MKKYISFASHLFVIIPLILFLLFPLTFQITFPKEFWILGVCQLFLYLSLFYTNYNILVPKILFKTKGITFIILLFVIIFLAIVINNFLITRLDLVAKMTALSDRTGNNSDSDFSKVNTLMFIIITFFLLFISTTLKVNNRLKNISNHKKKLEQEKISSELAFLKAQINPHFYFNVLHVIYALTETDVEKAQNAIHSLSSMMRYIIYETKHHSSTLNKEIEFIKHYIKLMELRIPQSTKVIFNYPNHVNDLSISSMVLLPFIENAFKHGITYNKEDEIVIELSIEDTILTFNVRNPISQVKINDLEDSNGIDLSNTKRRLDLLYPNQYNLQINEDKEKQEFIIKLKLNLAWK
ncbi:histidine kinase [Chishuiella sp.]|uniref:sensor histidine kinase n=1 Tax=Chishuiella sp. TaxID=1969467 RepID=UPI0028AD45E4|nr:histidine kinase [Chishuiella sp.]